MLINKRTQASVDSFVSHPGGSMIVAGTQFSGIDHIVTDMCNNLLRDTDKKGVLTVSRDGESVIGVEKIRELKQWLTTRFSKSTNIARVVVIKESEKMTHEAQNALLKVLEEPITDTVIILESSEKFQLLDTIKSRCRIVKVLPIEQHEALLYATATGMQEKEAVSAYALSGGESELFEQIVHKQATDLMNSVENAKKFLRLSIFERLSMQAEYSKSSAITELISVLTRVSEAAMMQPVANVARWSEVLRVLKRAESLIERNTAPKLIYTFISVNL